MALLQIRSPLNAYSFEEEYLMLPNWYPTTFREILVAIPKNGNFEIRLKLIYFLRHGTTLTVVDVLGSPLDASVCTRKPLEWKQTKFVHRALNNLARETCGLHHAGTLCTIRKKTRKSTNTWSREANGTPLNEGKQCTTLHVAFMLQVFCCLATNLNQSSLIIVKIGRD